MRFNSGLKGLNISRNAKTSVPSRMCIVMSSEDGLVCRKHVQTKFNIAVLYCILYCVLCSNFFSRGSTVLVGQNPLFDVSRSHSDTPHSLGLLRMSDRPVAVTPYLTTHKTLNRHTFMPRRDSNSQS
jgi:hypothetical protein